MDFKEYHTKMDSLKKCLNVSMKNKNIIMREIAALNNNFSSEDGEQILQLKVWVNNRNNLNNRRVVKML